MKELVRYTAAADQARLARNAMNRSRSRRQRRFGPDKTIDTCMKKKLAFALCLAAIADAVEIRRIASRKRLGSAGATIFRFPFSVSAALPKKQQSGQTKKARTAMAKNSCCINLGGRRSAGPNPYHWKNRRLHYRGKPVRQSQAPPEDK